MLNCSSYILRATRKGVLMGNSNDLDLLKRKANVSNNEFTLAVQGISIQLKEVINKLDKLCEQKKTQQDSDDQFRFDWYVKTRKESKVSKKTLVFSGVAAGAGLAALFIESGLASIAYHYIVDLYMRWRDGMV